MLILIDRYTNEVDLHAVTHGEYVPLEDVPDEVFSTKMMGEGYAIESQDGQIFAHQKTGVYIGNFVALPHGEEEAQQWIKEEGLFLIQVPDGVDFGTKEQPKIATILFVVVLKEQQLAVLLDVLIIVNQSHGPLKTAIHHNQDVLAPTIGGP